MTNKQVADALPLAARETRPARLAVG